MLINFNELSKLRNENKDKVIVSVIGSFDLFHYEHLRYLQDAKKLGDILVVILKDDYLVGLKGDNRPVITCDQRIAILDELRSVDYIVIATKDIYEESKKNVYPECNGKSRNWLYMFDKILSELKPDILYHENTHEYDFARNYITRYGVKLVERERTAIVSTTKIIDKIKKEP